MSLLPSLNKENALLDVICGYSRGDADARWQKNAHYWPTGFNIFSTCPDLEGSDGPANLSHAHGGNSSGW